MSQALINELVAALRLARDSISLDRTVLADCHMDPVTNALDTAGAIGVAEYDYVLKQIDAALAKVAGEEA